DIHPPNEAGQSEATAVNNRGEVTVVSFGASNGQSFIYSGGRWVSVGRDDFAGTGLVSINESGAVAGFAYAAEGRAMFYSQGVFRFVDLFWPSIGVANDINNSGHVAGYSEDVDGGPTQSFWFDGEVSRFIGGIEGTNNASVAAAIND